LPLVIFVTAYDEFAVKAFSANALDYILKPMDPGRVRSSLRRVRETLKLRRSAEYSQKVMEALKSFQAPPKYAEQIMVRTKGKICFVEVKGIRRIEAADDYIHIFTAQGKYMMRETMKGIEQQLDPSLFARISRSNMIRLDFIRDLQPMYHGEYIATLKDGMQLTVSRKYKRVFRL
jgi:two-component system, LytTR family, response regulator